MGKHKKPIPTKETPNAVSTFWKQRCAQEVNGRYKSTVHNIINGNNTSETILSSHSRLENTAIRAARKLRDQYFERKVKVPREIFKSKRIVLPIINRNFNSLNKTIFTRGLRESTKRRGKKCYEPDQKMSWMKSSIDLSYSDGHNRNSSLTGIKTYQSLQNLKDQSRRSVFSQANSPEREYSHRKSSTHSLRDKRIEIAKNRIGINSQNAYYSK
ncbi:unnamed protein product [Moneuplotes crassus]|uniref:Uncharacterized protein n=1 Tax=Euplotes crassus TaxID=5936 RepID=A0AAD1XXU3_EUPCR|nr:unnamed protein product [Moneuplotes crassus]